MTTTNVIARVMLIAFGAFLVAVPWLISVLLNTFWVSLIAEIMIWSLFAASVNLLFGYVGLLSFGQALYFGLECMEWRSASPLSACHFGQHLA